MLYHYATALPSLFEANKTDGMACIQKDELIEKHLLKDKLIEKHLFAAKPRFVVLIVTFEFECHIKHACINRRDMLNNTRSTCVYA